MLVPVTDSIFLIKHEKENHNLSQKFSLLIGPNTPIGVEREKKANDREHIASIVKNKTHHPRLPAAAENPPASLPPSPSRQVSQGSSA